MSNYPAMVWFWDPLVIAEVFPNYLISTFSCWTGVGGEIWTLDTWAFYFFFPLGIEKIFEKKKIGLDQQSWHFHEGLVITVLLIAVQVFKMEKGSSPSPHTPPLTPKSIYSSAWGSFTQLHILCMGRECKELHIQFPMGLNIAVLYQLCRNIPANDKVSWETEIAGHQLSCL